MENTQEESETPENEMKEQLKQILAAVQMQSTRTEQSIMELGETVNNLSNKVNYLHQESMKMAEEVESMKTGKNLNVDIEEESAERSPNLAQSQVSLARSQTWTTTPQEGRSTLSSIWGLQVAAQRCRLPTMVLLCNPKEECLPDSWWNPCGAPGTNH